MTKIAAIQFSGNIDKDANVEKASELIAEAASHGANIICLSELFNTIYFCTERKYEYFEWAETVPGPTIDRLSELARKWGIVVIAPIFEKVSDHEYYNSAIIIGPDGEVKGKYRKTHIPLVHLKEHGITFDEKFYFKPGNTGFELFATPFGVNIGVIICADRRFPEGPRILGLKGAHVIFVPTALYVKPYLPRWELELKAHAIMNMCYLAGVNRVGFDAKGLSIPALGSCMIVNPNGEVIAKSGTEREEIIYSDIDIAPVDDMRATFGFYRDRRPEMYGEIVK